MTRTCQISEIGICSLISIILGGIVLAVTADRYPMLLFPSGASRSLFLDTSSCPALLHCISASRFFFVYASASNYRLMEVPCYYVFYNWLYPTPYFMPLSSKPKSEPKPSVRKM